VPVHLGQSPKDCKVQAFRAKAAALRHAYFARVGAKLTPGRVRQLAQPFRETCTAGDRIGFDAAEICRHVFGTDNLLVCLEHIEVLCDADDRAPEVLIDAADSGLAMIVVDRRAEIRQRPRQTEGPPPESDRRPLLETGTPVNAQRAKSFTATSPQCQKVSSRATPAAGPEDFCASHAGAVDPGARKTRAGHRPGSAS
jgi:hypothetical protein